MDKMILCAIFCFLLGWCMKAGVEIVKRRIEHAWRDEQRRRRQKQRWYDEWTEYFRESKNGFFNWE